ncbi:MAG: MBL fold metallo-hydrolase [Cytophagales bacterium]|nr:MBL fold metallo-hydrolase [Cytophagales bacterium]
MMQIKIFVFNPFFQNTSVLSDESGNAIIIDPGCYEEAEFVELFDYISSKKLKVLAIINTHGHIDHVLGNAVVKEKYMTELWVSENEKELMIAIPSYASSYGFADYKAAAVDHWFKEGPVKFGDMDLIAIEVPGHSPGHMALYHSADKILIAGDILFRESIGRTDLPGGNHEELLRNIKEKVYTLPNDVTVYPGHGPVTTIGHEKQFNPFVRA